MAVSSSLRPLGSIAFGTNELKCLRAAFNRRLRCVGCVAFLILSASVRAQTPMPGLGTFTASEASPEEACIDFSGIYERADTFAMSTDSVESWRALSEELLGSL